MIAVAAGVVTVAIWLYLLAGRGGFWLLRRERAQPAPQAVPERSIAAIVPARNEADVVGRAVSSLLAQEHRSRLHVFLVDDDSSDGTAEAALHAAAAMEAAARLTVVRAGPLPAGWTGKVWAQAEGLRAAESFGADYFLLTDADIAHGPQELARLLALAESGGYDLVSLMARLACNTAAERALVPAFVFFFFMLYPPAWVARRDRKTAAAAGGCMLVRRQALMRIGGIAAIRGELIDDCALARAIKASGSIWLGSAGETHSLRPYSGWPEIGAMISRSAFTQLRHSVLLLAATLVAMSLTFLAPLLLVALGGWPALCGAAAWFAMSLAYWPALHSHKCSPLWAPLLPLIAVFYMGATVHSAVRHWQGRGGLWKGRTHSSVLQSTDPQEQR